MQSISSADQNLSSSSRTIYGALEGEDARILAAHAKALMPDDRVLMHVALDSERVVTLKNLLSFFAPDIEVIVFPAWDCLPYDRVSPNADIVVMRIQALVRLMQWNAEEKRAPRILLTTVNASLQKVVPRDILKTASFAAEVGQPLDIEALNTFFLGNGYSRTETVREAGEYALRGGIIDLFPAGEKQPLRIDLFGDEIESIKFFDPETQRTQGSVNSFSLMPASEYLLDEDSIKQFRSNYRETFGVVQGDDPLYEAISEGRRYNGAEHWLSLFYNQLDTLFDYVPNASVTLDHNGFDLIQERLDQIEDFYQSRLTLQQAALQTSKKDKSLSGAVYHPIAPDELFIVNPSIFDQGALFSPFAQPGVEESAVQRSKDFADIRALPDGDVFAELRAYITTLNVANRNIVVFCYSEGSRQRLKLLMETAGIHNLVDVNCFSDVQKMIAGQVGLTILPLEHGFVAPDLAVITEADILGERLVRKPSKRKKADNFLTEISALAEGDLVVHVDHGVGKFLELETMKAADTLHDCLKIEYAGGDKLYVPVESLEVLSRFGSDEGSHGSGIQLDKLGGAGWQARKARVKKNLMEIADHLLKIAASRTLKKAQKLDVSKDLYDEFAARFPYHETEDQERSIQDVLADMAGDYPMDRLICGDVGFGKTEVAMRAAYVAAMSGGQVAVVVPTTLLSRQHYQNFMARFSGIGLQIAQLSRMVPAAEQKRVKDGMADGSINIVIGTHALFGKGIQFDNLGLLIVDEEQRFGVKHKERLKELKSDVHILTLTATPIPRTLQMSLTGVKEMSLITTPPIDRHAVRTFVMPFDAMVIKEALMREHHRGGQSFYVVPRIKDLKEIEETLNELVPEIKTIAAHGQMTPTDLEDRMSAFYERRYDLLLATNIIESGIDIPSANTMIIHRADMFGLAQLYQIRGRIGRSKTRAYAYLTYQPNQKLNKQAQKRLEVMETLDTLGAGFQLASHDMDIRGAGNLLGDQQSGHIKEVGVELYQQMLEEAVAAAREGFDLDKMDDQNWAPQINIGTSVLIPETYVEDLGIRMSLYRRLQDLQTSEDIESFAAELIDRFGDLPEEVKNLLDIVAIKQLCKQAGVAQIEAGPKGAVIGFHDNLPPNVEGLMRWISSQAGSVKLRPDQKLAITRGWENADRRAKGVQRLMQDLAGL